MESTQPCIIPPGKYFLGDPCYASREYSVLFDGFTAFGDGVYRSNRGGVFSVDSGTLGLVPWGLCDRFEGDEHEANDNGQLLEFSEAGTWQCKDGVFTIISSDMEIVIDTT